MKLNVTTNLEIMFIVLVSLTTFYLVLVRFESCQMIKSWLDCPLSYHIFIITLLMKIIISYGPKAETPVDIEVKSRDSFGPGLYFSAALKALKAGQPGPIHVSHRHCPSGGQGSPRQHMAWVHTVSIYQSTRTKTT